MHTEVVASVKSRDEIMGLLFSSLALLQTLRYVDSDKMKDMLLSAFFFFCARAGRGIRTFDNRITLRAILTASAQPRVVDVKTSLNDRSRLERQRTVKPFNCFGTDVANGLAFGRVVSPRRASCAGDLAGGRVVSAHRAGDAGQ